MGLCSSIAQWSLTPHVCSWATRKLSVFIKKTICKAIWISQFQSNGLAGFLQFFYRFHSHGKIKKNILVFLWRKEINKYTILLIYFFAKSQITDENNYWWNTKYVYFFFSTIRRYRNFFWNFYISYLQLMKINHYMYMCMLCNIITRFIYF